MEGQIDIMHRLTQNFECWVTKDGKHFAVHNISKNNVDGGYKLGEIAEFEDNGQKYSVTITDSEQIDLRRVN